MYTTLPPKGMRDFLPARKEFRDEVASRIRASYKSCGFTEIETSAIENLSNLTGGDGGENTKLIFKILKRGDKFEITPGMSESDIADLGLRFDFTLPLARFYSGNRNDLPPVFKSIQMGNVYRGERPAKGRYRSFVQCDVDIIGEAGNVAEIEILNAIIRALESLDFRRFVIKINDRRFLTAIIEQSGFDPTRIDDVCISLDKLDKIGRDGVTNEMLQKGLPAAAIETLLTRIETVDLERIAEFSPEAGQNLVEIAAAFDPERARIEFDPTLVRGMGYYTGTIFEIFRSDYPLALGGGGRYDRMIGKFSGSDVPAVGFAIGFERICDVLEDEGFEFEKKKKLAVLFDESVSYRAALAVVNRMIEEGYSTSLYRLKKKFGKQLQQLARAGYIEYAILAPTDATAEQAGAVIRERAALGLTSETDS